MEAHLSSGREIPDSIHQMATTIIQALAPHKVILFGSYAYGNVSFDSDVDLLIIIDTKLQGAERQRAVSRLIHPRSLPMDIIVKTPEEIVESQTRRLDPFIKEILEKGIVLYG